MKKQFIFLCLAFLLFASKSYSQEQGQLMLTLGMDAYKTDNNPFSAFKKFQGGFEANYFVADKVSVGLGFEYYGYSSGGSLKYITFSPRLYPIGGLFLRAKPLIPLNRQRFDVGVGLGYDIMLGETWAIELAGDYYIDQSSAGFRLGFAAFF
jgi:hypothetical protein